MGREESRRWDYACAYPAHRICFILDEVPGDRMVATHKRFAPMFQKHKEEIRAELRRRVSSANCVVFWPHQRKDGSAINRKYTVLDGDGGWDEFFGSRGLV